MTSEVAKMPKDFWPETLMVVGRQGNCEIAFVMPKHLLGEKNYLGDYLRADMDGLRAALWQKLQHEN